MKIIAIFSTQLVLETQVAVGESLSLLVGLLTFLMFKIAFRTSGLFKFEGLIGTGGGGEVAGVLTRKVFGATAGFLGICGLVTVA